MPSGHVPYPNHEGHEVHEGLQDEAFDSILQLRDVEIDNQSDRNFRQSHVGKNLRLMNREQSFNALDFHNDVATYEQIDSITAIEQYLFVANRQGYLHLEWNPACESSHAKH
jgi:hypothetical protein